MNSESKTSEDILDVSQFSFEGDFDTQIWEILSKVRLSRSEVEDLQYLINDLEQALQKPWRGCTVYPFGSVITGLGIKTSDVDCYVEIPPHYEVRKKPVIQAKHTISRMPDKFTKIVCIPSAKVPILKFLHLPTMCHCDASFKSPSGVRNSKLIAYLMCQDTRVMHLAVIVKYWSKICRFTGTNLMASYTLTMMVIFYLQEKKILPSLVALQNNVPPYMVDCWNTAFDYDYVHHSNNDESLYQLLGGFFQYYRSFNFDANIISPFAGYPVKKQLFKTLDTVPKEFMIYKENVTNQYYGEIRVDLKICIQDVFDHSRNCAVALFPKLVEKVLQHFRIAAQIFEESEPHEFLKVLLSDDSCPAIENITLPHLSRGKVTKNKAKHYDKKIKQSLNRWCEEYKIFGKCKR